MKSICSTLARFLILLLIPSLSHAQIPLAGTNLSIDFSGFDGSGFAVPAGVGQLSSSTWLLSEATSLAQGISTGGETALGIYAYDEGGDRALWIQSGGAYMNPGTITLVVQNNTGMALTELNILYEVLILNDEERANSFNFSFSEDNVTFLPHAVLNTLSAEASNPAPKVVRTPKGIGLTGLNIINGANFALRWELADVSGIGARDEFGLDNIQINTGPVVTATELRFSNLPATFIAGQTYEIEVCATDAAGNVAVNNTDPLILAEVTVSGAAIGDGVQGGGCKTFFITPSVNGPIQIRSGNGIFPDIFSPNVPVAPGTLFFSEYVEGSGSNRCLEIYNASGQAVDLGVGGYEVVIYNNGATSPDPSDVYPLTGVLAPGDVYVICNENAGPDYLSEADQTEDIDLFVFTGNDAIELRSNSGTVDVIGRIGEDPGDFWAGGGCDTENETLIRNPTVNFGDNSPNDPFDPSLEWTCQPKNTWAYIGYHNLPISATELRIRRIEADSAGCLGERDFFAVEICAFDAVNGYHDPGLATAITLSSNGTGPLEFAGLTGGNTQPVDENGCATFYLRNLNTETITLTASSAGITPVSSQPIPINTDCPDARLLQAVINPCGNESQNEFMSMLNGSANLDLANLTLASIDHVSGSPQPNYNFTFNSTGTATPDNPSPCNLSDNLCLQWLNVNDAVQRQMLINLRDELNTVAGCNIFEIPDQTGGTYGEIPAGARMMVFLGAGGDGTLGTEGFDDAANNLDFSSFCASGIQPVYMVVSTQNAVLGGYVSNADERTIRVIVNGSVFDVQGTDPEGIQEAEVISAFGEHQQAQACVPPTAFDSTPLPVELLNFSLKEMNGQGILLSWETAVEINSDFFAIERMQEGSTKFEEIAYVKARGNDTEVNAYQYLDHHPGAGHWIYRLKMTDLDGQYQYSGLREVIVSTSDIAPAFTVYPQPASDHCQIQVDLVVAQELHVKILGMGGNLIYQQSLDLQTGNQGFSIDLSSISNGIYLLEIWTGSHRLGSNKLLIQSP